MRYCVECASCADCKKTIQTAFIVTSVHLEHVDAGQSVCPAAQLQPYSNQPIQPNTNNIDDHSNLSRHTDGHRDEKQPFHLLLWALANNASQLRDIRLLLCLQSLHQILSSQSTDTDKVLSS